MKLKLQGIASIALTVISLSSCKKEELFNKPPIADAGPDQVIIADAYTYQWPLHGKGKDLDGKIVAYLWSVVSAPSVNNGLYFAHGQNGAADILISPSNPGVFILQLMVIDDDGAVGVDTVKVTYKSK